MRYVRLYDGPDGGSRFGDVDVTLAPVDFSPPAPPVDVSAPIAAERALFMRVPAGWEGDWHPAPRRQFWIGLGGRMEVTAADGETRVFGPGDVLLVEDTGGRGHRTRVIGDEELRAVFVQFPELPAGA